MLYAAIHVWEGCVMLYAAIRVWEGCVMLYEAIHVLEGCEMLYAVNMYVRVVKCCMQLKCMGWV